MTIARLAPISEAIKKFAEDRRSGNVHLCGFCYRHVEKPCTNKTATETCTQSVNKTRSGGAGARSISFNLADVPLNFHTFLDQVRAQHGELQRAGKDPLQAFSRKKVQQLLQLEAERRFIEWQKASRKFRPWYEVLKIPLKGSKHEVKVVRKFRDFSKVEPYIEKRTQSSEGSAGFQMQVRNGVVPVKPKTLLGFDPNQQQPKESIMAKAKAKKGKKAASNGAAPKVKKDKAYYMKVGANAEKSGDFIRFHILQGKLTAQKIAEMAKKKFKGTTKPSDVYWNRGQLKAAGIKVPDMPKSAD
jgi:hypothetical protein